MKSTELPRNTDGTLATWTDLGGYPIYYVCQDGGVLCPKCAREAEAEHLTGDEYDPQWNIIGADVNYEDANLYCDHRAERIPSAYAEPE